VREGRPVPSTCYNAIVRVIVARCSVTYEGRLGARLPEAIRLLVLKADGSIAVHCDSRAYKPLNWMSPPCSIRERDGVIVAESPKGETLRVELIEVLDDRSYDLGDDPGLEKDGVEAELQELIAARVEALRDGFTLIRREYPTDIGPVDLLCRDVDGRAVVVEVKRVGEIAGVEQLIRYQERLDLDTRLAPTRGMFVATRIKPQARVFAASRGIDCVEIALDDLREGDTPHLKLF
jgi:RecB family endonuclease NucS